jgi:hypothetical protein
LTSIDEIRGEELFPVGLQTIGKLKGPFKAKERIGRVECGSWARTGEGGRSWMRRHTRRVHKDELYRKEMESVAVVIMIGENASLPLS